MALGQVIGPIPLSRVLNVQINHCGVILKNHQLSKSRLIMDLSDLAGSSVNDGIDRELCSLKYILVNDAVWLILDMGPGTLIAKPEIESAYRV